MKKKLAVGTFCSHGSLLLASLDAKRQQVEVLLLLLFLPLLSLPAHVKPQLLHLLLIPRPAACSPALALAGACHHVSKGVGEHLDGQQLGWVATGKVVAVNLRVAHLEHIEDGVSRHLAKDGVLLVQPGAGCQGEEELRGVGARARVCHGNLPSVVEPDALVDLILKGRPVNRLATAAAACGITALNHKILDDAMKDGAIVVLRVCQEREREGARVSKA